MILTSVYLIPDRGPVQKLKELPSTFGGAAYVWSTLGSRFVPDKAWHTWTEKEWHLLSSLLATDQMSFAEKAVFCATLDYAVIERSQFGRMNRALRRFVDRHPHPQPSSQLEELADLLHRFDGESGMGIGLRHDTAITDPWQLYDPGQDRYRPYDTSIDSRHWNLFETLSTCIDAACQQLEQQITLLERLVEQRQTISQFHLQQFTSPQ
jgi:hypothetical protein